MIFAYPPAPVAGRWFVPSIKHQIDTIVSGPGDGKIFYYAFRVTRNLSIDRMALYFDVLGAQAGGSLRIGIYNDNNGLPGTLLVDAGDLTLVTTTELEATVSVFLVATLVYWMAIAWDRNGVATADPTLGGTDITVGTNFFRLPAAAAATIIQDVDIGDGYLTADIGAFTTLPDPANLVSVARVNGPPGGLMGLRIKAGGSGFGPYATQMILVWGAGTDKGVTPGSWPNQAKINSFDFTDGDLIYYPFSIPFGITVESLGIEVATAQAGGNVNVAIYADDGTGQPRDKLIETGNISTASTGDKKINIADTALQGRKNYWMALIYDGPAGMRLTGLDRPAAAASLDELATGLGGATSAEVLDPNGVFVPVCKKITGRSDTVLSDPALLTGVVFSSDDLPMARFTYITQ